MNIQLIIVIAIILLALLYGANHLRKRTRAFSTKASCGGGCGCGDDSKKVTS